MLYDEDEIDGIVKLYYCGRTLLNLIDLKLDDLERNVNKEDILRLMEQDLKRIKTSDYPYFCKLFDKLPKGRDLGFLKELKQQLDEKMELVTV